MVSTISKLLGAVRLGEPVSDAGLTLIPVYAEFDDAPPLITLGQALELETLVVTEVDAGGAVPELHAANLGDVGVLILDGEELAGAKQNRVLNTSVYLAPGREITVPVSCTEHGRWRYVSERFSDSGYVAARAVRRAAHESVTRNVRSIGDYRSDQGEVWNQVEMLHNRHGVSPRQAPCAKSTSSARSGSAVARPHSRRSRGNPGCRALGRQGRGVRRPGNAGGLLGLHERLVRSYSIDALVESGNTGADDLRTAKEFWSRSPMSSKRSISRPATA